MDQLETQNTKFNTDSIDSAARVTLNGGSKAEKVSDESQAAIDAYLAKNSVTKCPPAGVPGSETCRATNEAIAKHRRAFRKANKG